MYPICTRTCHLCRSNIFHLIYSGVYKWQKYIGYNMSRLCVQIRTIIKRNINESLLFRYIFITVNKCTLHHFITAAVSIRTWHGQALLRTDNFINIIYHIYQTLKLAELFLRIILYSNIANTSKRLKGTWITNLQN